MRPLGVGVLGCAEIAVRRVLPALAAGPATELVAVASRDADKAARTAAPYGCAAVTGYQSLLERADVEAVYVPLPAALHADWVERALLCGRHVLAEKPLTTTAARTAEITALAAARGLVVMENIMFLQHPVHRRVLELLAGGRIGELRCFEAAFAVPARPVDDIRYRADLGGGALLDMGVYPLRAAQLFLGADTAVLGADLRLDPRRGVEVAGSALLRARGGVSAQLAFGMEHSYRSCYALWGSAGRIQVDRAFTPPAGHRPVVRVERPDGIEELTLEPYDQCAATVRRFAEAARGRRPAGAAAADALSLAKLVDSVRRVAQG
ncbi:Gfo/Idh/MocA family protein [Streptomyces sp. NPDC056600]|uniref:Gfo/Idh/MocA family protein n=1 Tax=Streptomyces sp. NPDC056600 TaxID=3345874 RepID=UPI0036A2BE84